MHRALPHVPVMLFSIAVSISGQVLLDDARLDYRSLANGSTMAGDDPVVFCDSVGNYTVLWDAVRSYVVPGYSYDLRGIAFDSDGALRTEERAVFGVYTAHTAGSETGDFVTTDFGGSSSDCNILRYRLNLAARDSVVFTDHSNLILEPGYDVFSQHLALSRNRNLVVGVTETGPDYSPYRVSTLRVYQDTVLSGDWQYVGTVDVGQYTVHSLAFTGPARLAALFCHQESVGGNNESTSIESRGMRATGSDLVSANSFTTVSQKGITPWIENEWPVKIASVERWSGAVGVFNDSAGLVLAKLDSLGRLVSKTVIDPQTPTPFPVSHDRFEVCASLKGGYAAAWYADSLCHINWSLSYGNSPQYRDTVKCPAEHIGIAMDGSNRRLAAWSYNDQVFVERFGSPALPAHRVTADGADPRTAASVLLPGGAGIVSAWTEGVADSMTLVLQEPRFATPTGSFRVPVAPVSGMPYVGTVGQNVAVLYHTVGASDTNLTLRLWSTSQKQTLATVTFTDAAAVPGCASVAHNSGNLLVVWEDFRSGAGDGSQVYCQLFSEAGVPIVGNRKLANGMGPRVTANGTGGFAVTYTTVTTRTVTVGGIPVIRVEANVLLLETNSGGNISVAPQAVNTVASNASNPDICRMDSTLLVCWYQGGGTAGIVGRAFRGGAALAEPMLYTGSPQVVQGPRVAATGDSSAAVVWVNHGEGAVEYLRVGADGGEIGSAIRMNADSLSADVPPSVCAGAQGDTLLVSWITGPRQGWGTRRMLGEMAVVGSGGSGVSGEYHARPSFRGERISVSGGWGQSAVNIACVLSERGPVTLDLFGADGRRVRRLFGGVLSSGTHEYVWDGAAQSGTALPAGVYVLRLSTVNGIRTARVVRR